MNAQQTLNHMLKESGRKAILRSELLERAESSPSSCDRALRHSCHKGILVRVGQGIYGVGRAKVFDIVPEVMPKLGFSIEPAHKVRGYSQKSAGNVWVVDKPCTRIIRKKGVYAFFQNKSGRVLNDRNRANLGVQPTQRAIEDHFHTFEHCHSLARAEKDLIVHQALDVLNAFRDDRADFAMEGGTALASYYRQITRLSEDLAVRLILKPSLQEMSDNERIRAIKEMGESVRSHIHQSLPFLQPSNKGRIRQDGVLQTFIFDYQPVMVHDEVIPGLKVELAHIPLKSKLDRNPYRSENALPVVDLVEIAAGKWQALAARLPQRGDAYPDLVRHIHDLSSLLPTLSGLQSAFYEAAFRDNVGAAAIHTVIREVRKDSWGHHYANYMHRMGTAPISTFPKSHPPWDVVVRRFTRTAELLLTGEDKSTD